MISKIRPYINAVISSVDSDIKEIKSLFEPDVQERLNSDSYWMTYEVSGFEEGQNFVVTNGIAEIKFYFDAFRSESDAYDNVIDLTNEILVKASSATTIEGFSSTDNNKIYKITPSQISADQVEGNSRQIVVTTILEFGIYQTTC